MADVRAIKHAIAAESVVTPENTGTIAAYVMVDAVGFHGTRNFRRVRIGYETRVSVDTAKDMMKNIREANSAGMRDSTGPIITGRFVMDM